MSTLEETNSSLNANIAHYNSLMNSNSLSSGPASIPDFTPLSDAFDMTPTPSEADAMSVRATVSYDKINQLKLEVWTLRQAREKSRAKSGTILFSPDWSKDTIFVVIG